MTVGKVGKEKVLEQDFDVESRVGPTPMAVTVAAPIYRAVVLMSTDAIFLVE